MHDVLGDVDGDAEAGDVVALAGEDVVRVAAQAAGGGGTDMVVPPTDGIGDR
ncbi:hypothetical protein [Tunturiibacter gelidiferens]|uniref:hypothetical protein n=1 Tax=Tunturiibacter gelidiferens TaxID=3069689 RepID=UPI003D9BB305